VQEKERAYQSLVQDVTRKQRAESERVPLSGTVREVGFGVHILTVMFACFLACFALGRRLFREPGMQVALGAVGMFAGLLVEISLYMIKETRRNSLLFPSLRADKTSRLQCIDQK
jgi:hypothetical protein